MMMMLGGAVPKLVRVVGTKAAGSVYAGGVVGVVGSSMVMGSDSGEWVRQAGMRATEIAGLSSMRWSDVSTLQIVGAFLVPRTYALERCEVKRNGIRPSPNDKYNSEKKSNSLNRDDTYEGPPETASTVQGDMSPSINREQGNYPLLRLVREFWVELSLAVVLAAAAALAVSLAPTMLGKLYDVAAHSVGTTKSKISDNEDSLRSSKIANSIVRQLFEKVNTVFPASSFSLSVPIAPFLKTAMYFTFAAALRSLSYYFVMRVGSAVKSKLQSRLMRAALRQDLSFYDKDFDRPSELAEQIRVDIEEVKRLATSLATAVAAAGQVIVGMTMISFTSPALASLILLSLPPGLIVAIMSLKCVMNSRVIERDAQIAAHSLMIQTMYGLRTIRSFGAEDFEQEKYDNTIDDWKSKHANSCRWTSIHAGLFLLLQLCGITGWLYAGSILASMDILSVGQLSSIISHSQQLGLGLASLSSLHDQVARAASASTRLFAIIDAIPCIEGTKGYRPITLDGRVSFQKVSFAYPSRPEEMVLQDLDLELTPGTVTAVVGGSGSGKSTLTVLVQRFYDPDSGCVSIDGLNLKEMDLHWYRKHVAVVSQEPQLFPGSILDNIRYGRPEASLDEVIAAAKVAKAHEFISQLNKGYQTQCGDRGLELSGGQKQRIAIARAVIAKPTVLILDEATSALDIESERSVQAKLSEIMKNASVLVVAHRLSTIQNADKICVMRGGRLVESGTHYELLHRGGPYSQLLKQKVA